MITKRPLLLEVDNLSTHFHLDEGTVHAVNGATFKLYAGETLGIVGESGCGKSVLARSILRMVPAPGRIVEGRILYHRLVGGTDDPVDLTKLDPRGPEMRAIRGLEIAMVFQEPMSSLSPVHTVGDQVAEAILLHRLVSQEEAQLQAVAMLDNVGMPEPARTARRYSHELSGGMCQRAMIAMALASYPDLLIADEPTTALDVTTEAQILQLMRDLQHRYGMAIMYITHNLGVIAQMTERVIVMYLGRVVEMAEVDRIFHQPLHPYTQALLRSVPRLGQKVRGRRLTSIKGMVPNAYEIPRGCPFHPRCPQMRPGICDRVAPPWLAPEIDHWVRCVLYAA
ncbi:MAG: ABC transporter ATP-binding protein [Anaerolineae bacterium]|nr:ABC transporter ATP-binding protein [Anaerolineae bacterium]